MKNNELRNERGVLKMDDKKMREYLKNIELIAWLKDGSVEYTILNKNDIDYIFSNNEYFLIEDELTKKLILLSNLMTKYLKVYDNVESSVCYDLDFENLSASNSSHTKIKNRKGELIFKYKRYEPSQKERRDLENEIHQLIIDINNITVNAIVNLFENGGGK